MKNQDNSNLMLYLIVWLSVLLGHIIFVFIIPKSYKIVLSYFIIMWSLFVLANFYEGRRISNYLKDNRKDEYLETKTFNGIEGVHNGFSAIALIFSDDNKSDKVLLKFKSSYKRLLILILAFIISFPILPILIAFR